MFRVWLNRRWFGIHNKILNFHDWTLCYNELFHDNRRKWKSMYLSMDLDIQIIWKLSCLILIIVFGLFDYVQILFSNFWKAWLNIQLCGRDPIKSVLFICPSDRLYAVMHFPQDLLCGFFKNFLHEDVLSYIWKKWHIKVFAA